MTLQSLGQAVAQPYIARHYNEETGEATEKLVERARNALQSRIDGAAWLDAPTRQEALAKLKKMVAKVGHPKNWEAYEGLAFASTSYLDNAITLSEYGHERNVARLDMPVDRMIWTKMRTIDV